MSCNFSHPGIFEQRLKKTGQWVWEELLFGDYCPIEYLNDEIPLAEIPGVESTMALQRCWMNPDTLDNIIPPPNVDQGDTNYTLSITSNFCELSVSHVDTVINLPATVEDPAYALGDSGYCPLNVSHIDVFV